MKRLYLLLLLLFPLATMYKSSNVFAIDPPESEYLAAMSAIKEGTYYLVTEVGETKWYITQNGSLTDDKENACLFAISKVDASNAVQKLFDTAFLIEPNNGAHFSNATPLLDGNAYLHLGFFYQDSGNDRNDWERQVFYLKNGKYAIRTSNTIYGETSWLDAGRVFWSCEPGETDGSVIPCYNYEPAYVWTLELPPVRYQVMMILQGCIDTYANQYYDDEDNPSSINLGTGFGQYSDVDTWHTFKVLLENIAELIDNLQDSDYDYESDPNAYTIEQANAMKAEAASLWQKILDSEVLPNDGISFADINVKAICVANWDTNNDGELSYAEAAAVTDLGEVFKSNQEITSFDELKHFTSLLSINNGAFIDCHGLTSITIPKGVTSMGDYAFDGCSGLTNIIIPKGVTSIGERAFFLCNNLTTIVVEEGNTLYDSRNGCNAIIETTSNTLITGCRNTTIPDGVTSIKEDAFYECCLGLTTITIPKSVTSIGNSAFWDCDDLASITIQEGLSNIGDYAFEYCNSLTSVTIPSSVATIGDYAFYSCNNLASVIVLVSQPLPVTENTFSNRANATLYVPAGSKAAYESADYWKDFKEIIDMGGIIAFEDANVKAICVANWDTNNDGELSYAEAAAVTDLGEVFNNANLEIISFNELQYFTGLTSICEDAFSWCSALTSITIPSSVTSICEDAFEQCSALTSITIPNSVTSVCDYAFRFCSALASITIPSNVTSIGYCAFRGCNSLKSIVVEEGNPVYDSRNNCNALIETASNTLIKGCDNSIIPEGIISIGDIAFGGCTNFTSIIIPNSVKSIGISAFSGCKGLTSITIPNSVTSIDVYAFSGCIGLTSATILNESIGSDMFVGCTSLASVTFSNNLTTIIEAFGGCTSLTSITIPNSVTYISGCAFYGCSGLTHVISEIEEPFAFGNYAFDNISDNCILTVPIGTRDAYIAAGWNEDVFKGGVVEAPEEDTDISQLDNLIYLEATEAKTGSQKVLSIKLKNSAAIRGFQFDLYLPEGVTVAKTSKGKIDGSLSAGRLPDEDEHNLTFSEQTDGAIRFLCSSQYDETFTGTDGEIATLTVNIADNMADGDYPIVLKNMKLTETDISKYYETQYLKSTLTVFSYIIGDINNDGVVDVSDYTGVANHIHGNTPTGFNAHAADVDENGSIDVSDYTGIANIIHTGSIYGAANVRMAIKPKKQKVQEKDPE